jgi:hypothetical protein
MFRSRGRRAAVARIALLAVICLGLVAAQGATRARAAGTTVPTLGSMAFADQQTTPLPGFGTVRPSVISYEGDPTSSVGGIHWSSWGGARATGHGSADWVWPGWCVACGSVELPATVVAFDKGPCDGGLAYRKLEWFFPTRGMTFDTRLGNGNVCAASQVTRFHEPPHGTCGSEATGTALAEQISRYGYGLTCTAARRFVVSLRPDRYLNRSAKFQAHGWWCGTEITPDGPQSISCSRGDFDDVFFTLAPRAE